MPKHRIEHSFRRALTYGLAAVLVFSILAIAPGGQALDVDALGEQKQKYGELLWPLCGRWGEDPAYTSGGCPESRWQTDDLPIYYAFGPRNFRDDARPVSWHKGLDFGSVLHKPVFAAQCGEVKTLTRCPAGDSSCELDERIIVRHFEDIVRIDPGAPGGDDTEDCVAPSSSSCSSSRTCMYTVYNHVSADSALALGDFVQKGQQIATTGKSTRSGQNFEHLHFETLFPEYAAPQFTGRRVNKDSVNPLNFLPYDRTTAVIDEVEVSFYRESGGKVVPIVSLKDSWDGIFQNHNNVFIAVVEKGYQGRIPAPANFTSSLGMNYAHNGFFNLDSFSGQWTPISCSVSTSGTTWSVEAAELPFVPPSIDHRYAGHPCCPSSSGCAAGNEDKLEAQATGDVPTPLHRTYHYNYRSVWAADRDAAQWEHWIIDHGLKDFHPRHGCVQAFIDHTGIEGPAEISAWGCGLQVLLPLYVDPANDGWVPVAQAAGKADITAIVKPTLGKVNVRSDPYVIAMQRLEKSGVRTLGHVATNNALRPLADVQANVQAYINKWDAYGLDGIFFDEVPTDAATASSYFAPLRGFIEAHDPSWLIVLNPGTTPSLAYRITADVIVTFQDTAASWASTWQTGAPAGSEWMLNAKPSSFAMMIHGYDPSSNQLESYLETAKARGFGFVFITDDTNPDPWDVLTQVWQEQLDHAESVNDGLIVP